jgi:hypothetical protein
MRLSRMEMQAPVVDCRSSKTLAYCLFQTHVEKHGPWCR